MSKEIWTTSKDLNSSPELDAIIKFTSHKLDLYYRRMEKKDEMILKPKVKGDKGIYTNCNLT